MHGYSLYNYYQMADIQQKHQLAMKQLTDQHTSGQSELHITQFKSQLATQQVSLL